MYGVIFYTYMHSALHLFPIIAFRSDRIGFQSGPRETIGQQFRSINHYETIGDSWDIKLSLLYREIDCPEPSPLFRA